MDLVSYLKYKNYPLTPTQPREVKEMMEAKEGGIPATRQLLRTRGGKFLCKEGWSLEEYGIGKESTLVCSATHNNAIQ